MINKLMKLPTEEQNKLIFEFLSRKQEFIDFAKESLGTKFNEGDLVFNGRSVFIIHKLSIDQHICCEHVMSRYEIISREEYEKGIVNFKTYADDNSFDDPYGESNIRRLDTNQFQKLDKIYLFCGFEKFRSGRLKKSLTYVASIDDVAPSYLLDSTSKIGKITVV